MYIQLCYRLYLRCDRTISTSKKNLKLLQTIFMKIDADLTQRSVHTPVNQEVCLIYVKIGHLG